MISSCLFVVVSFSLFFSFVDSDSIIKEFVAFVSLSISEGYSK